MAAGLKLAERRCSDFLYVVLDLLEPRQSCARTRSLILDGLAAVEHNAAIYIDGDKPLHSKGAFIGVQIQQIGVWKHCQKFGECVLDGCTAGFPVLCSVWRTNSFYHRIHYFSC